MISYDLHNQHKPKQVFEIILPFKIQTSWITYVANSNSDPDNRCIIYLICNG